jgi:uncharacterized protein
VEWPGSTMDEATFVRRLLAQTNARLLLDLSNLHANARNHGYDAGTALRRFPLEHVAYAHLAGGIERHGVYHDTHAHPLLDAPLELLRSLSALRAGDGPRRVPGAMLERDACFPAPDELARELEGIRDALRSERESQELGMRRAQAQHLERARSAIDPAHRSSP